MFTPQGRDLPQHAHRIYFSGSNSFGDSLVMSPIPHAALKPFVFKKEFARFAKGLNTIADMPMFGWEAIVFRILCVVCFPLAYRFRKVRGACLLLLCVVANELAVCMSPVVSTQTVG